MGVDQGVYIENNLSEAANIKQPLILHFAENDQFVSPEAQVKIKTQLSDNPLVNIHTYPAVNHAFARPDSQAYNQLNWQIAGL